MVDIGAYGKDNDARIFDACLFRRAIESGKIKVPEAFLPNSNIKAPFVLLSDSSFPLKAYLLKLTNTVAPEMIKTVLITDCNVPERLCNVPLDL